MEFASPGWRESGILNEHGKSNQSRGAAGLGRGFARGDRENLRVIRAAAHRAETQVLAVVKSNAYGLGAVPVAKAFQKAGAERFGVTCANEGIELRESGIRKPILVLTGFWPEKRRPADQEPADSDSDPPGGCTVTWSGRRKAARAEIRDCASI